ncbi:MAG: sigma-54 dependent transcriptional regulator [Pseudomonadota bacterium]
MERILVIDDDEAVLNYLFVFLTQTQRFEVEVLNDSTRAFGAIDAGDFDLVLLDMDMPGVHGREILQYVCEHKPDVEVVILTGVDDIEMAVESMKKGAYDYLCKPVNNNRLLATLERALERARLRGEISKLQDKVKLEGVRHKDAFNGIVTQSRKFLRELQKVEQIAESENNVLIWGSSGTGKELIAQAIHKISSRRNNSFIAVNAGAFASELFSSEFFGHEKGAFTGAVIAKKGFFEEADGGTLLLDEIGELELPVQAKLLRVLQGGEYFRVGSTERRGADVRIIASTNKDLAAEIEKGRFRRDLYYRLNICSVFLPPLRERRGDVELLAYYFCDKYSRLENRNINAIAEDALGMLDAYDFPGNVRELENIIAGAVVLEKGNTLSNRSLPPYLLDAVGRNTVPIPQNVRRTLMDLEAEHIRRVLKHTRGNRTAAAQVLGISRPSLLSKIKKYGIDIAPSSHGGGHG